MSDIHALSGAYVTDALDDVERAAFERHLQQCEVCGAEVASLRDATAQISDSVAVPPPAALRERVLAQVAVTRPLPPTVRTTPVEPARRRTPRWAMLAAAAAVVAAVGGGVAVSQPWQDDSGRLTATEQVVQASDAQRASVTLDDGARATVVRSKQMNEAVLLTSGMPPAPSEHVYQVWFQNDAGQMVSAGLMPAGAHQVMLDGDARHAQAVGITVEPAGGSPQPTTEPLALIQL